MRFIVFIIAVFVGCRWGRGPALIVYIVGRILVALIKSSIESKSEPQPNPNSQNHNNNYSQNNEYFWDESTADNNAYLDNTLDTYYAVLGVAPSATDNEVKQAYHALMKKNHPDLVGNRDEAMRKTAERKTQEINEAYETIKYWRDMK